MGRHLKRAEWRKSSKQSDCRDRELRVRKGVSVRQDEYDLEMERREESSGGGNIFLKKIFIFETKAKKKKHKNRGKWKDALS